MNLKKNMLFFIISGIIATIIDLTAFNIYLFYTENNFVIARIGGIATSLLFTFIFNKKITFASKSKKIKSQFSLFVLLYLFSMTLNTGIGILVITIAQSKTRGIANIAAILGTLVSMIVNFLGSKYIVFKK